MSEPSSPRVPLAEWLLLLGFVLGICAPAVLFLLGGSEGDKITERERRNPASMPRMPRNLEQWALFPESFDVWYGEQFGLRNVLLGAYQRLELELFESSPTDTVLLGEQGWIFLASEHRIDAARGAYPFPQQELDTWRDVLVARKRWLASLGIDYVFVLAPGKGAVYPERLPAALRPRGESRREEFLQIMREQTDVTVIDLAPALIAEKEWDQADDHAYYPLGSHWTGRGAAAGYRALVSQLPERFRRAPVLERGDLAPVPPPLPDDMSRMFLLEGKFEQQEFDLRVRKRGAVKTLKGDALRQFYGVPTRENQDADLGTALLFHDSFGGAIHPLLAYQFSRMHRLSTNFFSPLAVERLEPDIVIDLYVDHQLAFRAPHLPTAFGQAELAAEFAELGEVLVPVSGTDALSELLPGADAGVVRIAEGLLFEDDTARSFRLPVFPRLPGASISLRIELSSSVRTYLTVAYPRDGARTYENKFSTEVLIDHGRQTVHVSLPASTVEKPLLIQLGRARGRYVVHALEVRRGNAQGEGN